jgi:hypothetical protein
MKMPWRRRGDAPDEAAIGPIAGATPTTEATSLPTSPVTPGDGPASQATLAGPPAPPVTSGVAQLPLASAAPRVVKRRGLIPRWVPWAAGGVAGAALVIVVIVLLLSRTSSVRVPSLAGLTRANAIVRAKELGLVLVVQDTRFSARVPSGTVISQYPVAGAVVSDGSSVKVDVSAGSETFAMPDVVGKTLDVARRSLRDRGLDVQFQTTPSDAEQGTIISSLPSAGANVTTGDTVRLTVAAGVSATDTLLPSDLSAAAFVLDPTPPPAGATTDVSFDVARRVRALLEASGARVTVTRAVTDTAATATSIVRLRKAKESTSTALVGLVVGSSGASGLQVLAARNTSATATFAAATNTLAQGLLAGLRADFPSIATTVSPPDAVMEGAGVPAVRIRLGSNASSSDKVAFADPQWADNVARDIYRALAQAYGRR